ncbi:MAG: hypothetical protein LAT84_14445 [Balneolia bacterium]|nr:hypothetical protein [Balneolia bacterium]
MKLSPILLFFSAALLFTFHPAPASLFAQNFEEADHHALNAPADVSRSVSELSAFLSEPFEDDALRARSVFSWIAHHISYDTRAFRAGTSSNEDPEDVLRNRTALCGGYAALFKALAEESGLEAEIITGHSRGYGVDREAPLEVNHAWNAVRIDGNWKLVDPTWGAGHIASDTGQFVRRFTPHYFFTEPGELIYHHFPEDSAWQLIAEAVSEQEFQKKPVVKPAFFEHSLSLHSPSTGKLETTGRGKVELRVPESSVISARLMRNDAALEQNQVLVHHTGASGIIEFNPTVRGQYELQIFVKKSEAGNDTYEWAVSYHIRNNSEAADPGFPETFSTFLNNRSMLIEPKSYLLEAGSDYQFSMMVPGAESVSVVSDDNWTDLSGSDNDSFSGTATVRSGPVRIAARFPGSDAYHVLLEYIAR